MAYQKQEWVEQETIVSAERMGHIEDGIADADQAAGEALALAEDAAEAVNARAAVAYVLNSSPSIPSSEVTVPTGWTVGGTEVPAITYGPGGWVINRAGVFLIALNGSYANASTSANLEYRLTHNGTRVLAVFGAAGDVSSRSGTTVITAAVGDVVRAEYYHAAGMPLALRPSSFNAISFAQIS